MKENPIADLNNFLQSHSAGNLAHYFSWRITQEGPNHQAVHHATAIYRGVPVGEGKGVAIGLAKRAAAMQALNYFLKNGVPLEQD